MDNKYEKIRLGDRNFTPVELSSKIIEHVYENVKDMFPENKFRPSGVVLTVPYYFRANQCSNTEEAAKMAGLNLLGIIQEPIAAAFEYGLHLAESCSNIDRNILVFSSKNPELNLLMLDRFLLTSENKNLNVEICITKIDLDDGKTYNKVKSVYEKIGYPVFGFSKLTGEGMEEIKSHISTGGTTIFSGNSGVGKSTLINYLNANLNLQTGEISKKLSRGKHTTRHVEIFKLGKGYIVDTPGFSSFELDMDYESLENLYPEFREYIGNCYFTKCSHIAEPKCAIKEALKSGLIDAGRYERFCMIYKELKENFKR
jgi:ribosome biogenesis GTPase